VKIRQHLDTTTGTPVPDCPHCVGGYRPLYLDPVLGAVFDTCPICLDNCSTCHGHGIWTDACCLTHLVQRLYAEHRLTPLICPGCRGITDLYDSHTGMFRT
jgi:hypothetical protein